MSEDGPDNTENHRAESPEGSNELAVWIGIGLAVGAGVGLVLMVALGQPAFFALGVGPGLMFGAAIGAARSQRGEGEVDEEESQGQR